MKIPTVVWANVLSLGVFYLWMGNLPIALALTAILFGLVNGVQWLIRLVRRPS